MWPQYKFIFATKSSQISESYKFVQKIESEIEIFPVSDLWVVGSCPAVCRSQGPGTRRRRRWESHLEKIQEGVASPAGGTRHRGCGSLAMELDAEMHGAPPRAPWKGTSSSAAARAMEQEAEAEPLALTRLPSCILLSLTAPPPLRPKTPSPAARSRSTKNLPLLAAARPLLLVQCGPASVPARQTPAPVPAQPPPGPCSSSLPAPGPFSPSSAAQP
jgi:hypothetical protein